MKQDKKSKFDFSGKEKRIYLASPYTHRKVEVMQERYEQVSKATADLFKVGYLVFSPIIHCHPIAVEYALPKDYNFWKDYSDSFLRHWAEALAILLLPGALNSKGVRAEITLAKKLKLPIYFV